MTTTSTLPAIRKTRTVNAPIEDAFRVFTESFGTWWPSDYHIGQSEMVGAVLEPRVGGRWYERGADGSECDWGRVLEWDPPHRLVLTWQIGGDWRFDPDRASEVEVRFTAEGPQQTTVELEHRYLERLAEAAAAHGSIGGDSGWGSILASFAAAIEDQPR